MTRVIFRVDKTVPIGDERSANITAFFPDLRSNSAYASNALFTCYCHLGQHSSYEPDYLLQDTRAVSPEQYQPLLEELTERGYDNLKILKRLPRVHKTW